MRVCLFDIDGTLIASGGAGRAALEGALERCFGLTPGADIHLAGRTDRDITRDMFRSIGIEESDANWTRFRAAYLELLPQMLHERQGQVLPGVHEILATLSQRDDLAIGLLTGNIRDGAKVKLSHYGIHHYFAFGGFGDHHHDRAAVAREAFDNAQSHLARQLSCDDVWIIGDTPADVACARAIGAAVAVATGVHAVDDLRACEPDLVLTDLSNPEPWFQAWR